MMWISVWEHLNSIAILKYLCKKIEVYRKWIMIEKELSCPLTQVVAQQFNVLACQDQWLRRNLVAIVP